MLKPTEALVSMNNKCTISILYWHLGHLAPRRPAKFSTLSGEAGKLLTGYITCLTTAVFPFFIAARTFKLLRLAQPPLLEISRWDRGKIMNNSREDRHYRYCCGDTPDNNDPFEKFDVISRVATIALSFPFTSAFRLHARHVS